MQFGQYCDAMWQRDHNYGQHTNILIIERCSDMLMTDLRTLLWHVDNRFEEAAISLGKSYKMYIYLFDMQVLYDYLISNLNHNWFLEWNFYLEIGFSSHARCQILRRDTFRVFFKHWTKPGNYPTRIVSSFILFFNIILIRELSCGHWVCDVGQQTRDLQLVI